MTEAAIRRAVRLSKKEMAKKKKKRRHFDDGGDVRGDSLSRSELASMNRDYSAPSRGETVNDYTRSASETTDTSDRRGGREDYTPVSPTVDQTVAELNRQAMDTSGFGEETTSPSLISRALNIANQIVGITPAEAGQSASSKARTAYEQKGLTPQPPINYDAAPPSSYVAPGASGALFTGTEPVKTNPFEGMFVSATGSVYPGPAPQLQTGISTRSPMSPDEAYGGTSEEFETQPEAKPVDISSQVGSGRGVAGPTAQDIADQRFADMMQKNEADQLAIRAMGIGSGRGISGPTAEQIKASQTENVPSTITGYHAGTELGPYGVDVAKQRQDDIAAALNKAAQETGAYNLPSTITSYRAGTDLGPYDATLAAANIAKQIMAKQETGAAAPVSAARVPSPSARVPLPPIPYRDLGAGSFADKFMKLFGMDTESWINRKAADYEKQGMSPSDAAIQASYDLRDIQLSNRDPERRQLYGADAATRAADKAVLEAMMKPKTETTAVDTTKTPTTDVTPKLPEIGEPYVPTGQLPYVPSGQGYSTGYLDLGASASIARQAAYNQAVENALRLLKLA